MQDQGPQSRSWVRATSAFNPQGLSLDLPLWDFHGYLILESWLFLGYAGPDRTPIAYKVL